jgi:hypothetical protein
MEWVASRTIDHRSIDAAAYPAVDHPRAQEHNAPRTHACPFGAAVNVLDG